MPVPGSDEPVSIAAEEAVITYDVATHTERFIRKADFDAAAKGFAFLVPTPGKPVLSLSDNVLFQRLRTVMKKVVVTRKPRFVWSEPDAVAEFGVKASAAPGGFVEVESSQRIGGFDTTVLRASDTGALFT